jgi:ABC-type branched-subunit amino acid transport system permease subunit
MFLDCNRMVVIERVLGRNTGMFKVQCIRICGASCGFVGFLYVALGMQVLRQPNAIKKTKNFPSLSHLF